MAVTALFRVFNNIYKSILDWTLWNGMFSLVKVILADQLKCLKIILKLIYLLNLAYHYFVHSILYLTSVSLFIMQMLLWDLLFLFHFTSASWVFDFKWIQGLTNLIYYYHYYHYPVLHLLMYFNVIYWVHLIMAW